MIHLRWIYWETAIMRHHKLQCSVLIVTNKNHTKERLTNHKFAEELHDPPPPLKLLNRICIDLKNDPNGSEKKTEKSHAWMVQRRAARRSKRVQPTRGWTVAASTQHKLYSLLLPHAMGARFYRFLGRPAKWTRWLAGAAAMCRNFKL